MPLQKKLKEYQNVIMFLKIIFKTSLQKKIFKDKKIPFCITHKSELRIKWESW